MNEKTWILPTVHFDPTITLKKWILRELLVMKAEENLGAEMKDASKELEDYNEGVDNKKVKLYKTKK